MSDSKDNKKQGFFSRIFGGNSSSKESSNTSDSPKQNIELPTKTTLNKLKKADLVALAKENNLELDMKLTKAQMINEWEHHFKINEKTTEEVEISKEAPAEAEAPVEQAPVEEEAPAEAEAPVEQAPAEEEVPAEEEAAAEEETPVEEEAPTEESPAEEEATAEEEAPTEEPPAEEEAPAEEVAPSEEEAPAEEEAVEDKKTKVSLEELTPAQIIKNFEISQMKSDIPDFRPGDTVVVSVKVKEGERTRLQAYEGVVMSIKNAGLNSSFIVRKISSGIGVERTFQTHSPLIDTIKVKRKGDVRKAKLFYLRDRSGKSARIKERLE